MKILLAFIIICLFVPDLILLLIFWACDQKVRHTRPWNEK